MDSAIGSLVGLLERLDREGKHEDALRVARTLSKLLSLARRWLDLLKALQAALRAGQVLSDDAAVAWAKHELGTAQLVTGDVGGAQQTLTEAREIRARLGDRNALAATEDNLRALSERAPQPPAPARGGDNARPPLIRLLPAIVVGVVLFGAGVAGGVVVGGSGNDQTAATMKTATKTETVTENGATQTQTETVTEPVTETETITSTVTVTEKVGPGGSEVE